MKLGLCSISIITALMVSAVLFGLPILSTIIHSQTVKQLPTRIQVEDTPADITFSGGLSRVVGNGDFNGDGVDEFLVEYQKLVGEQTGTFVFIIFGTDFTGSARVEINGVVLDGQAFFYPDANSLSCAGTDQN